MNLTLREAIVFALAYWLMGAVNALPDRREDFQFYPWLVHSLKNLINAVPPQYKRNLPPNLPPSA